MFENERNMKLLSERISIFPGDWLGPTPFDDAYVILQPDDSHGEVYEWSNWRNRGLAVAVDDGGVLLLLNERYFRANFFQVSPRNR